jgi:hypothetical protein
MQDHCCLDNRKMLTALSFGGWWLQSILLKSLMGQGAVVFAAVGGA